MWRLTVFAALLGLSSNVGQAKDLGVQGTLFEIIEPDLFGVIRTRLEEAEAKGEIDRINRTMASRTAAYVERPPRVEGITPTAEPRTWTYDPTIALAQDIVTPDGQVLGRKGDTINPLEHIPMNRELLFFDGDDPEQVAWAKAHHDARPALVDPILIAGPVMALSRKWGRQVFFDQRGLITTHFGIRQVPARITRDGTVMRVEEIKP